MLMPLEYQPYYLLYDCGFLPAPGTLSDYAETTPPVRCYKFVNHEFNTRILIKLDEDELD